RLRRATAGKCLGGHQPSGERRRKGGENMSRKAISFQGVFVVIPFFAAQAQDLDVSGNLNLVNSTPTAGNILKAGVPFVHNFGTNNTFIGSQAGNLNMRGVNNTASGAF